MDPSSPTVLDNVFRLERPIARGGMGEIWAGTDLRDETPVAIKLVPTHIPDKDGQLRTRLVREARAIAELAHPHVVKHISAGFDGTGQPYLVLEWLDGENLEELRHQGRLQLPQVLEIVRQVLAGLGACHAHGIVHRDIKPGNIFVARHGEEARVKLIDFGLALFEDSRTRVTAAGEIMGTLYYLSPEQARGMERSTFATDIYSVGVVLYELLTGRVPFRAEKPLAVLLKIVTETPPRPRQLRPDLPRWLEAVMLRAMQRDPAQRFASAEEMAQALQPPSTTTTEVGVKPLLPRPSRTATPPPPTTAAATQPPWTPTPENRLVSLLCIQPADARSLEGAVRPPIERAGGILHRLMGGRLIGIFGIDQTSGDEALRAVRAGLLLRGQLGEDASLAVATIHLSLGEGLEFDAGDLDRAIALLAEVPAGELMLDQSSRDLTRERIKLRRRPSGEVVIAMAADDLAERPVLGVKTPMVGREEDVAYLRARFDEVEDGKIGRVVLVTGAPGIGKSRLCRAVLPELRARSALCLEARAVSSRARTPYNLLVDAISRLAGLNTGDDDEGRRRALSDFVARYVKAEHRDEVTIFVGEAIGLQFTPTTIRWSESLAQRLSALRVARSEPKVMRAHIVAAIQRLLLDASSEGPVTVLFEDLHWADDESLALLAELAQRLPDVPIFFLGTARPEIADRGAELVARSRHRLELRPLGKSHVSRLLRAVLGRIATDHEQRMLEWCDGNPYFAEELVSWMVARKLMVFGPEGWQLVDGQRTLQLPVGIEGAIQGRLDRLGQTHKELLKAAAVFGDVFWSEGCEALGFAGVQSGLERLAELDFVSAATESAVSGAKQWAFRHTLLQQVAYSMQPAERRRELHLQAAAWLERAGELDAALLAHHYQQGGNLAQAAAHQARAAERALADGDLERAVRCFKASLEDVDEQLTGSERLTRLLGLARARILRGEPDEATRIIDRMAAAGAAEDPRLMAELLFLRGRILLIRSRYPEAETLLTQAIAGFDELREKDRSFDAKHTLFWAIWVQGRYDDAGPLGEQMHREASPSRPEHLCAAKLASAFHNMASGDLAAAIILAEQAADHAREVSHPYREVDALSALGAAQELVGLYQPALASYNTARSIAERLKTAHHLCNLNACLGRLHLTFGELAPAREHYRRATTIAEQLGDERSLAIALAGQARVLCRLGDAESLDTARRSAEQAAALTEGRSPPEEAEAKLALAETLEQLGDVDGATRAALAAVDVLDLLGTHELYEIEILLAAHRTLERAGQPDKALQYLGRAWRALRRRGARITTAAIRESFHQNVPHNRSVQQLWRQTAR